MLSSSLAGERMEGPSVTEPCSMATGSVVQCKFLFLGGLCRHWEFHCRTMNCTRSVTHRKDTGLDLRN